MIRAAWWLAQLLLAPIALGRVHHDVLETLAAGWFARKHGAEAGYRRVGYRLVWWVEDAHKIPSGERFMIVLTPMLVGGLFLVYGLSWIGGPVSTDPMIEGIRGVVWLNLLAIASPSIRDLELFREIEDDHSSKNSAGGAVRND